MLAELLLGLNVVNGLKTSAAESASPSAEKRMCLQKTLEKGREEKKLHFPPTKYPGFCTQQEAGVTSSVEKSRCVNVPGVGGIPWENHLAAGVEQLDLHVPMAWHTQTRDSLCPGGCRTVQGGAEMEHRAGRDCWQPQEPGRAGAAQSSGADSWLSLGLGFSLGCLRVLPAASTEVWGKNTPLGYPILNPSCGFSLPWGGGILTQEWGEKGKRLTQTHRLHPACCDPSAAEMP